MKNGNLSGRAPSCGQPARPNGMVKRLPAHIIMPLCVELIGEGKCVVLTVKGGSMAPFLVGGRDTVTLAPVKEPPVRGDIVLYRRDSGQYVLHRICRTSPDGSYTLIGDAQTQKEPGISPRAIIAVVRAARRKGRSIDAHDGVWRFFERAWLRIIPLRRAVMGLCSLIRRAPKAEPGAGNFPE